MLTTTTQLSFLVQRDSTGITVKRCVQDYLHVRIGIFTVSFWGTYCIYNEPIKKPHDEFTLNELRNLLEKCEKMYERRK
jgi:hypothetical protein